jgi:hypothetical protein
MNIEKTLSSKEIRRVSACIEECQRGMSYSERKEFLLALGVAVTQLAGQGIDSMLQERANAA